MVSIAGDRELLEGVGGSWGRSGTVRAPGVQQTLGVEVSGCWGAWAPDAQGLFR